MQRWKRTGRATANTDRRHNDADCSRCKLEGLGRNESSPRNPRSGMLRQAKVDCSRCQWRSLGIHANRVQPGFHERQRLSGERNLILCEERERESRGGSGRMEGSLDARKNERYGGTRSNSCMLSRTIGKSRVRSSGGSMNADDTKSGT